jgi:hypothetical protein
MPSAQRNDRSALCLLALLKLTPDMSWNEAQAPLVGITPMMEFARKHYGRKYAPNTRETFRRQSVHQLVAAGIALYNPDDRNRAVNSPKAVYQVSPPAWKLLRTFGTVSWNRNLAAYLKIQPTLISTYAKDRDLRRLPVTHSGGQKIRISPGEHIKGIIEEFAARFVPGGVLIYAGDTGKKWGYFDGALFAKLGVNLDGHGKMPDVILYDAQKHWLILIESVTSHGPMDGKRHAELAGQFSSANAGVVYVTAFPSRSVMARHLGVIAWETEVWCADAPSHLIHFNGSRYLGPY